MLDSFFALLIPMILLLTASVALCRKVNVFDAITTGAASGLSTMVKIFPNLVCLLTAVYMLRASGAMDALANFTAPVLRVIGIPEETVALMLVRPISGSGALAVGAEIIQTHGPDSFVGRVAAVMIGGTETTLYIVAVYFGAVGVTKTRYAIPVALFADLCGFIMAAVAVRVLM